VKKDNRKTDKIHESKEKSVFFDETGIKEDERMAILDGKSSDFGMLAKSDLLNSNKSESFNENAHYRHEYWFERVQRGMIPVKIYRKLEYWIAFELGSRLKPEAWLFRVEIAVVLGAILAGASLFFPIQALATLFGVVATLLAYLYLN
jgi:hypothetical protein